MAGEIHNPVNCWCGSDHVAEQNPMSPDTERVPPAHRIVDGYCFDCNGGCLVGFGNSPEERCPIEGCDELPEDHHHPACNNPRHDEIEAWYRQAVGAQAGPPPLSVERLALAMENTSLLVYYGTDDPVDWHAEAEEIAAEYVRLSRPSDEREGESDAR